MFPLQLAVGLNILGPAPVFPLIMEDLGLTRATVSLLVAGVTMVITLSLIPGSLIISKLGSKRSVAIGGVLMSIGLLGIVGLNFWLLMLFRIALGLGIGLFFPGTTAIVTQWFNDKDRPIINGLNFGGQGLGISIGMFASVPLASAIGWETMLLSYSAVALVGALIWIIVGRSAPVGATQLAPFPIQEVVNVVRERNSIILAVSTIGPFAIFIGFSSWLPTFYHEELGMTLERSSALVSILPTVAGILNIGAGLLLALLGLRKPLLLSAAVLFPIAALGTFAVNDVGVIIASLVLLGCCFSMFIITLLTIPMELPGLSVEKVAVTTAAALTLGNLATVVSPLLIGFITDRTGSYTNSFYVLAICSLTVLVAGILLPETGPKRKSRISK